MKVTQKQAEFVLQEVAAWLGKKGMGEGSCPEGRELGKYFTHADDGSMCFDCEFGPAPTGPEAAYNGYGPELNMAWDWAKAPTVILESGYAPDSWAIYCCDAIQQKINQKGYPIYVEPYTSYALSIYPE